jgi:NitT/TauT family transport system substrate-binding protein
MAAANRDFKRKHPIATKRALRAMLKATDLCVSQPERAARLMADRGVADKYEYVLESVKEIGFQWREYESEDTVRFWALRRGRRVFALHRAGVPCRMLCPIPP